MMRFALIFCAASALAGQAMADADCDAASARWLELASPDLAEKMGESLESQMQDPVKRWQLISGSYIGSALAFNAERSDAVQAETIVVLDTLVDCLQPDVPEADRIDSMYPAEKRKTIRDAAETIMKDGN